jgi:hypothetical protein
MTAFRCYLLDANNKIVAGSFLQSADLTAAIADARGISRSETDYSIDAFEIWQDTRLLHREIRQTRGESAPLDHVA